MEPKTEGAGVGRRRPPWRSAGAPRWTARTKVPQGMVHLVIFEVYLFATFVR